MPTFVVACAHDQPDFRRLAKDVASAIPGAESIELATGHLAALEHPDEFNRLALGFLADRSA